jgi:hypothetical protein
MNRFFRAVKAGVEGVKEAMGPGRYTAAGRPVVCSHCGGEEFDARSAQLNTTGATLAGLDWLNASGVALVCVRCDLIHWFLRSPTRVEP